MLDLLNNMFITDDDAAFHWLAVIMWVGLVVIAVVLFRRVSELIGGLQTQMAVIRSSQDIDSTVHDRLAAVCAARLFVLGEVQIDDPAERMAVAGRTATVMLDAIR